MKVLQNNYQGEKRHTRICPHCLSKLAIEAKDLHSKNGRNYATCPCCQRDFQVLIGSELTEAYYAK